jgi:hypothetical protein
MEEGVPNESMARRKAVWKRKAIIASKPTQTTNLTEQNKHEKNNEYS